MRGRTRMSTANGDNQGTLLVFLTGFVSGASLTVFAAHYNDGLSRHRQRRRAARFVIRHFEEIRSHFADIIICMGDILEQRGPNTFVDNVDAIFQQRKSILNQDSILDDLDDTTLRRSIESILHQAIDNAMNFPRKEIEDAWPTPLNPGTAEAFREFRRPIEDELLPNIDTIIAQLRERDVSFVWWIIRKGRQ